MGQGKTENKASLKGTIGLWKVAIAVSLACPLLFVIAVFGTRLGLWSLSFGFEILALQVGRVLAWVGLAAAPVACVLTLRHLKQVWPYAVATAVFGVASLAVFMARAEPYKDEGAPDVTTDAADPVAFSRAVMLQRAGAGTAPVACEGLVPVMRQSAPENALYAMKQAGVIAYGTSAFRADGYQESFWFGQVHHVAIRIRPGRTDVRVAARYPVKGGQEACNLAKAVATGLQPK